jgi:hypothetical protein
MGSRLTIGIGAGLGLTSSALIQLTDVNRLFLLAVLGLGVFIILWELAPYLANAFGASGKDRTLLPVVGTILAALVFGVSAVWYFIEHPRIVSAPVSETRGGDAMVAGNRSGAVGGNAGEMGLFPGGRGGDAHVNGDDSYARGGDGGNAPQPDGRGGRRTKSPGERENLPTAMWPYGYGGRGANNPEYDRRIQLLTQFREEYLKAFPEDALFIKAGVDQVPVAWVNKRLEEANETWRVDMAEGGYILPPLPPEKK